MINVFVIMMSVGCITCLVVAVVLWTDCFPNPHEARLGVNYESALFPRRSGHFSKLRHVLYCTFL